MATDLPPRREERDDQDRKDVEEAEGDVGIDLPVQDRDDRDTDAGFGEFRELRGTGIAILDVPARICFRCGTALFTTDVMRRLAVILDAAVDVADAEGHRNLVWTYTATGPPEFGGLGSEVRQALTSLSDALWTERRLLEATDRAAQALDPGPPSVTPRAATRSGGCER